MTGKYGTRLTIVAGVALVAAGVVAVRINAVGLPFSVNDVATMAAVPRNEVTAADLDPLDRRGRSIWLVIGNDRREGLGRKPPHLGHLTGERADTLMLCAFDDAGRDIHVVSLPRDLLVSVTGHGSQRLGGLLDYGSREQMRGVRQISGVPINHYVELDVVALVLSVDALGGLPLTFANDARDSVTGLDVRAGRHTVDGVTALAYARSRDHQERRGSRWVPVDADDRGRIVRQQRILRALAERMRDLKSAPFSLFRATRELAGHVSVDQTVSTDEISRFLNLLGSAQWKIDMLPTRRLVPAAESISPFPPAHLGTTGALVRAEPDSARLLRRLHYGDG